jgi:hypothetical protein
MPTTTRVRLDLLGTGPRRAVGRLQSSWETSEGLKCDDTYGTGFLVVFSRTSAYAAERKRAPLYLATSAHGVREEGKELTMALFYPQQSTREDGVLGRNEGVFEIAFDPDCRNSNVFISSKFMPVGIEGWEEQGGAFDLALKELFEVLGGTRSIEEFKEIALTVHLDVPVEVGDQIRFYGYPLAPEEERRAHESCMFQDSSALKARLLNIEGVPGALVREGLGRSGKGGSGGPWLKGSQVIGAMAWQKNEELFEADIPDSHSPYFSTPLIDSALANNVRLLQ